MFLLRTGAFIFGPWREKCGNRAALCMFLPPQTEFPMCLTHVWSTPRVDRLPHLPLDCKQGPLLHKGPDEWGPSALCAALAFEQGLIQSDWTGEEVEGGSSFNVQTLFYNVHRLSSQSVLWLILWATNIKKEAQERRGGESIKVKNKSAFLSACLECIPGHLPPGHSFPLPTQQFCHAFHNKKKAFNCEEVLEPALSWHVWCLFSCIKAATKAQSQD